MGTLVADLTTQLDDIIERANRAEARVAELFDKLGAEEDRTSDLQNEVAFFKAEFSDSEARVAELLREKKTRWEARGAELEEERNDRTKWISLRMRNLAQELEDRYRPLDEEVPKIK